ADERELDLAVELIERLAAPFQPERYRDAYREALLERIEAKVRGRRVTVPPAPRATPVVDLMEALRASLAEAPAKPTAGPAGRGP
ncbi:MAG TPA: Ku protein, partial [Bacillota bacterium]